MGGCGTAQSNLSKISKMDLGKLKVLIRRPRQQLQPSASCANQADPSRRGRCSPAAALAACRDCRNASQHQPRQQHAAPQQTPASSSFVASGYASSSSAPSHMPKWHRQNFPVERKGLSRAKTRCFAPSRSRGGLRVRARTSLGPIHRDIRAFRFRTDRAVHDPPPAVCTLRRLSS
jgi:hypothetical protein